MYLKTNCFSSKREEMRIVNGINFWAWEMEGNTVYNIWDNTFSHFASLRINRKCN